jgi:hypothetical protein
VFRGTAASYDKSELDLAGLVCNKLGDEHCINPVKGKEGGTSWEYRAGYIDGVYASKKKSMEDMRDQFGDLDL